MNHKNPFRGICSALSQQPLHVRKARRHAPLRHDDRRRHNEQRRDAEFVAALDRAQQYADANANSY